MNEIELKSRTGKIHKLVQVPEIGKNVYVFAPAEEWMPIYTSYEKIDPYADENELISVDTDGGPYLSLGSTVNGRVIRRIYDKKGYGILIEF